MSPKVYKGPWSAEEEKRLMKLANQRNCTDWSAIAREIGVRLFGRGGNKWAGQEGGAISDRSEAIWERMK